jgi:hypothetical protein
LKDLKGMTIIRDLIAITATLTVFLCFCASEVVPPEKLSETLKIPHNVVAFYNIYAQGPHFHGIVLNQVNTIRGGGLLAKLDRIYYTTSGLSGADYKIDNEKYVHLTHFGEHGEEIQTISLLYQYCHSNPHSKVLYFHNKGSFHFTYSNAKFCSILNCYVLNPNCIPALDEHDTCGWRISPTPHIHYSGNFWWARCSYINTLVDPLSLTTNETFAEISKPFQKCLGTDGRFFAESWIGTGPVIKPADCMNSSIDRTYVWGYQFPPAADQYCHGAEVPSGLPCTTASTFTNVQDFKHAINHMNSLIPDAECRNNKAAIIKQSLLWYGQEPETYLKWMEELTSKDKLNEGTLIRFTDSTQVYLVRDGQLRGFPNGRTFLAMGYDFEKVQVMYASERPNYDIGDMLPAL